MGICKYVTPSNYQSFILPQESTGEVSGVGFSDGRTWQEGRKFMIQNINNFVMKVCRDLSSTRELLNVEADIWQGRSGASLEDLVREEVMELHDLLKEKVGATGTKMWYVIMMLIQV